MIVLIGEYTAREQHVATKYLGKRVGRMWTTRMKPSFVDDSEPFGLDNGAFSCWKNGTDFDSDRFLLRAEIACEFFSRCVVAVVPDLVARGEESLEFSLRWMDRLNGFPLPWFLALQDGMIQDVIRPVASQFSGLFLGGTDDLKARAEEWCSFAHGIGKLFHYGRAGSVNAIARCREMGADSLDSTSPVLQGAFGSKITAERWMKEAVFGTGRRGMFW